MKPEKTALTGIDHAIDIGAGELMSAPITDVVMVPVMGIANTAEAEMRLLLGDMEDCFQDVEALLDCYQLTFEQQLEIYNRVPLGTTAGEIPRGELIALIEHVATAA